MVYVLCSEESIREYLPQGVKLIIRDKRLDSFQTKHYEIVESFVSTIDADIYVNAHVTNPFVSEKSIEEGISKILSGEYDSALTVEEIQDHLWHEGEPFNFIKTDPPRTQDLVPFFAERGVFIYKKEVFVDSKTRYGTKPYFIKIDKIEAIDINYQHDYDLAKAVVLMKNEKDKKLEDLDNPVEYF
jgi:CMP-N-acetylneuraminic acid synthetase